ncbi:MAG: methyltransferase domain-containing protein [Candidatus Kaiserbacteria bacterium]|nr:methyltransferase domain-containing protein [Candidatus Kaiserbacteria bacterium]
MTSKKFGPDTMTNKGMKKFFDFYKTHKSRALVGFLKDVAKSNTNKKRISAFLRKRRKVTCLILGCSYWSNPKDTVDFLKGFNKNLDINITVLDILSNALLEIVKNDIKCLPVLAPAQKTPFLDNYFDIIICDCLLTCCSFNQHEPVIKEINRIIKKRGILLLGVAHSKRNITFKMAERPIVNYCRPFADYKKLFGKYNFVFPKNSSIETHLPGKWSQIRIANGIVLKKTS